MVRVRACGGFARGLAPREERWLTVILRAENAVFVEEKELFGAGDEKIGWGSDGRGQSTETDAEVRVVSELCWRRGVAGNVVREDRVGVAIGEEQGVIAVEAKRVGEGQRWRVHLSDGASCRNVVEAIRTCEPKRTHRVGKRIELPGRWTPGVHHHLRRGGII